MKKKQTKNRSATSTGSVDRIAAYWDAAFDLQVIERPGREKIILNKMTCEIDQMRQCLIWTSKTEKVSCDCLR
jgi:hypothetical protein